MIAWNSFHARVFYPIYKGAPFCYIEWAVRLPMQCLKNTTHQRLPQRDF